jgi:hypothetical protein
LVFYFIAQRAIFPLGQISAQRHTKEDKIMAENLIKKEKKKLVFLRFVSSDNGGGGVQGIRV